MTRRYTIALSIMSISASGCNNVVGRPIQAAINTPANYHPFETSEFLPGVKAIESDTAYPTIYLSNLRYGIDTTADPCNDFYDYSNGGWRSSINIPSGPSAKRLSWNNFSALPKQTDETVKEAILNSHAYYKESTNTAFKIVGTFFESCVSADSLEAAPKRLTPNPDRKDSSRIDMCVVRTRRYLPEAVGQVFVDGLKASGAVDGMKEMFNGIRRQVRLAIENHEVATPEDIRRALERLDKLFVRVGIPDNPVSYDKLKLTSTHYHQNKIEIANFNTIGSVNAIGSDMREKWKMSFFTANASYRLGEHAIEVPPGMFTPPFYNVDADDAINYAAVGVIVGHEIFHSLAANLTQSENPKMKAEIDSFQAINSRLGELDGWTTDGRRTYNEDIADLGGVKVAYRAWKDAIGKKGNIIDQKLEGFTPDQRFFLAYGRVWRAIWTPSTASSRGPHAAPFARVNGIVRQVPQFAAAFGCKEGDPMALPQDKRSRLW